MSRRKLIFTIVGLLILQFLLGMLANLYSDIPKQKPYEVLHQFGFILFHALNAVVLLVLGIILVFKSRGKANFKSSVGGLANIVIAFVFGELFVFIQNDLFSFLMAFGFIGALMSYAKMAFSDN